MQVINSRDDGIFLFAEIQFTFSKQNTELYFRILKKCTGYCRPIHFLIIYIQKAIKEIHFF